MKTCEHCGNQFYDPKHKNKKYCSVSCYRAAHPRKTAVCPICQKVFPLDYHAVKYCSRKCKDEAQRSHLVLICAFCKKPFTTKPSRRKNPNKAYCSVQCRILASSDSIKKSTFVCRECGTSFIDWTYRKPRFCSHHCMSKFAARQPKPNARRPNSFVTLSCQYCGKRYTVHVAQTKGRNSRYCSRSCAYAALSLNTRGAKNPNYTGGPCIYGENWSMQKKLAIKRDKHTCQRCGASGYVKGRSLDIHHIKPIRLFKGDWQKANDLSNLITLCRSCHQSVERAGARCPRPK